MLKQSCRYPNLWESSNVGVQHQLCVDQTINPRSAQLQRQQAPIAMLLPNFTGSAEAPAHCHVTSHSAASHFPWASSLLPQSTGSYNPIKSNSLHWVWFCFCFHHSTSNGNDRLTGLVSTHSTAQHSTAQPEISFWSFQSAHYSRKQQPWSCAAFEQPHPHPGMLCKAPDVFALFSNNEFTQQEAFPQCLSFVYRLVCLSLKKAEKAQAAMLKVLYGLIFSALVWNQHIS